jgi:hypothetical protein
VFAQIASMEGRVGAVGRMASQRSNLGLLEGAASRWSEARHRLGQNPAASGPESPIKPLDCRPLDGTGSGDAIPPARPQSDTAPPSRLTPNLVT